MRPRQIESCVMASLLGILLATMAPAGHAQDGLAGTWRIAASTGAYVPRSALIRTADANDTRLGAGPAFSVEPQINVSNAISLYLNGIVAFGSVRLGSSIQPAVVGPSDQVTLATATAGLMLSPRDWLGDDVRPTLRLGGGLKWYSFDLAATDDQVRPTIDVGVGLRGAGVGPIEVTAEVRYLPSSFDQDKLPTRGIVTQEQRQNDLFLSIGIGFRP